MISALGPYPDLTDSGVPWLGDVPQHWEVRRLSETVKGCFSGIWGDEPNQEDDLPCVRVADFDRGRRRVRLNNPTLRAIAPGLRGARLLKRGDLLIEKSGGGDQQPVGMVVLYDHDETAVCSNFVARMPAKNGFDPRFLVYVHEYLYEIRLNARSIKQTTGIQNLDSTAYLHERFAVPSPPEQAAIIGFLDYACARIRQYSNAKTRLISLLGEQRNAIIDRAVTRGLKSQVSLRPSGVPWLGDVPEHWTIWRSKRLFRPRKELARPGDVQLSATQAYGVIPQAEYEKRIGRKVTKINIHLEKRRHVEIGDFVISMRSFQGGLERAWASGCIRSSYVVLRPGEHIDVDFFSYVFKSRAYIGALQSTANFIRDGQDLNFDNFAAVDLAVPPFEEQRSIACEVRAAIARTVEAEDRARREIDLLRELRARLIADVVTGKLDVREAAADLPNLASVVPTDDLEPPDLDDMGADELGGIYEELE